MGETAATETPTFEPPVQEDGCPARLLRIAAGLGLIGILVATSFWLPVREYLERILTWVQSLGLWGPVVLAAAYVVACVLFIPGSILTLGAGFLFGLLVGTITVSIGSTIGAAAAFLVGRSLLRDWVADRVSADARFAALDRAVGKQGFKIVLLLRLSPVFPFNLLNYAFGLTKVSLRDYILASWLGMLPATVMYVYLGTALKNLAEVAAGAPAGDPMRRALFVLGLVATVAATVVITRIARKALQEVI